MSTLLYLLLPSRHPGKRACCQRYRGFVQSLWSVELLRTCNACKRMLLCPRRRRNRHLGQRRGRLKFACFRSQRSLPSFGPLIYGLANLRQSFGIMPTMWFSLLLESGTINSGGWSKATSSIKRISVSQLGLWQIWMPKRVLIWQHKLGPSLNCKVSSPAMDLATDPFALCASKMKLSVFGICFFTWWRVHRLIGDLLDRADVTKKFTSVPTSQMQLQSYHGSQPLGSFSGRVIFEAKDKKRAAENLILVSCQLCFHCLCFSLWFSCGTFPPFFCANVFWH